MSGHMASRREPPRAVRLGVASLCLVQFTDVLGVTLAFLGAAAFTVGKRTPGWRG